MAHSFLLLMTTNLEEARMNEKILYVTEKEVRRMTSRALSTLRNDRFLNRGIPYYKIGRSVRYLKADVIDFMEAGKIMTLSKQETKLGQESTMKNG